MSHPGLISRTELQFNSTFLGVIEVALKFGSEVNGVGN